MSKEIMQMALDVLWKSFNVEATRGDLLKVIIVLEKALAQPKEWVGLASQDLLDVGAENYIGAIWADQRLREKNT